METIATTSGTAYKKTLNYLVFALNFNKHQAHSIINRYAIKVIGMTKPSNMDLISYYLHVGEDIQRNWQMFMEFYGSIKHEYPQKRPNQRSLLNQNLNEGFQSN